MSAREIIESVYTGENLYQCLRFLGRQSADLCSAIAELRDRFGVPVPEPPEHLLDPKDLDCGTFRLSFGTEYPIGYVISVLPRYTTLVIIRVKRGSLECQQDTVNNAAEYIGYRYQVFDAILNFISRYNGWLIESLESVNRQIDELLSERLESEEHRRFLQILETARLMNVMAP